MQNTIRIGASQPAHKIAILSTVLVLGLLLGISAFGHPSSAYTTIGTNSIQDTLVTQLVSPISPTYVIVNEQALSLSGLPSQVTMTLTSSYGGGAPYYVTSCDAKTIGGVLASCLLSVPLRAWGHYVLVGTVYGANGAMLAQVAIDPYIEPEW